ncbi:MULTISPECIES: cytochrome P450 [unclassified Streptomyces]|uniref:cytochrome P450 n=1 Tax=unclassified Streptomyces TaxID=2593676 RepID=UPI0016620C35|nr:MULTISPECIES: cytochrome P450 [unclassified Streptomyces]MBD0842860.1 cytochrome P450 [Streptomyces sp. TRM68416]
MRELPVKFDSRDPAVVADPYRVYAELRTAGRLARGAAGQWVVSHHQDVSQLLKDRRLGHEYPPEYHEFSTGAGPANEFLKRIVLDQDAPAHTFLRGIMQRSFSPRLMRRLEEYVTAQVDRLMADALDRAAGRGGVLDVVGDLAFPLPVTVVCELIGIPDVDRDAVRPHAVELAKAFALYVPEEERAAAHEAVTWLRDYVSALVDERAKRPDDDLVSNLLAARRTHPGFDRETLVDNVVFLFFAGFETTTNLISTIFSALLRHPGQLALLRERPELAAPAVEEFLRYDAPIQATARYVKEPVEIDGRTVRAGRILVLLLGSANHDPARFTDPGRLDITRDPNPHVSFGGGVHHCLGAALATVEGRAVLRWLANAPAVPTAAGTVERRPSVTFRAYRSIPVRFEPTEHPRTTPTP